jgi:hypothetical protein
MKRLGHRRRLIALLAFLMLGFALGLGGEAQQNQPPQVPPEVREWMHQTVEQLSVAIREAVFAPASSDLGELRVRAARVLNTLVGPESPEYRADVGAPPGADGVGVLVYLRRLQEALEPYARENERVRAWIYVLQTLQFFSIEAVDRLNEALHVRDPAKARRAIRQALAFLIATRGSSEDPLSEGGARALWMQLRNQ